MNNKYLTQIDYIKVLLEEDRLGEALNNIKDISSTIEKDCIIQAKSIQDSDIKLPKFLVKTKPNNWIFLKETWMKLLSIDKNEICLEISNGIVVKNKYILND